MRKFICNFCGYIYEGDVPPERCPECGAGGIWRVYEEGKTLALNSEHMNREKMAINKDA